MDNARDQVTGRPVVVVVHNREQRTIATGVEIRNRTKLTALSKLAEPIAIGFDPRHDDPEKSLIRLDNSLLKAGQTPPHLFVLDSTIARNLIPVIRARYKEARIVVDFHNVESLLLKQQDRARFPKWLRPLSSLVNRRRWRRARETDMLVAAQADRIWVCSQVDAARLGSMKAGLDIDVIANLSPIEPEQDRLARRSAPSRFLFIGHLGYAPNKRAVRFLVKNVMPRLRGRLDGARLIVAGYRPNERLLRLLRRSSDVEVHGSPSDLAPLYEGATVFVAPLFEGGGTRIKILEAACMGLPIVASALAVEGLGFVPGTHYVRAETATEFASRLVALSGDEMQRRTIARQAMQHVGEQFTQEAITSAIAASLSRLDGQWPMGISRE